MLERLLSLFESHCRVIGIDICGESKADVRFLLDNREEEINNASNLELLRFLLKVHKKRTRGGGGSVFVLCIRGKSCTQGNKVYEKDVL